jgi:hypothetical protein
MNFLSFISRAAGRTGKFCNRSRQLLPAAAGETDFIPAKASILTAGTASA